VGWETRIFRRPVLVEHINFLSLDAKSR